MSYFRELPDLEIPSFLSHKNSSRDYVRIKNIFRRVKFLDWLKDKAVLYVNFQIPEDGRPDTVADLLYGSPDYDWVILITADIINVIDEWPLSNRDVYKYTENKYTLEKLNDIHHYETVEVRDENGRLILPKGKIVDSDFKIIVPPGSTYINIGPYESTTFTYDTTGQINPVVGVSNYEYEVSINDKKREIRVLNRIYLQQFLNDMRVIMKYDESSEFIDSNLSRTENNRLIIP